MDKVVHFEIPAENRERAARFYEKCFGWQANYMPEFKYTSLVSAMLDENRMPIEKGAINGGMMERNPLVKSPVITIQVEEMDAALERVRENGGKPVGEALKVGDMGLAAYFEDTEGNVLGLWQQLKKN